jgi:hypothetical protein
MNEEFKKVKLPNETRYVLETTTAGAIGTNSIATAEKPLGELQRRQTISVPVNQKPRQGPMKSQTGAGAHRDKKKEQKQGKEKHRKPFDEEKGVAEGYVNDASEGTKFMIVYNKHHPNPAAHGKPVTGDGKPWIITATDRRAALDKAHEYFVRSQTVSSFRGYVDAVPVEQDVAEGFSDVVKGIKRKVAGKDNPKDVEHTYARIARRDIEDANKLNNQAAYDARDKSTKRWKKVNKVVNKQGAAGSKDKSEKKS